MHITRREFLVQSAGGLTLAAASACLPAVLARTARAATQTPANGRILVMLQLTGGNDGLNTVVPFRDENYRRMRPTLAIARREVHALNDEVGLCPQLRPLKEMFDDGWLSVVQGVGYPNPNRSHFESMDIWHCADPSLKRRESGWLGRALELDAGLAALNLDEAPLPLALRAESVEVPSVQTIESFRLRDGGEGRTRAAIEAVLSAGQEGPASDAEFIRRTAVSACENARRLEHVAGEQRGGYPAYGLARRLRQIARLIASDFGPRIYYTSLGGFDTHARQRTLHPALMDELGQSVRAFFDDLKQQGLAEQVLLVAFSEFGRRAEENASLGTDHGAAAPVILAGPGVRPGVIGPSPDLSKLVDGDVPHRVDFREIYAAVLEKWLSVPSRAILGERFTPIDVLRSVAHT